MTATTRRAVLVGCTTAAALPSAALSADQPDPALLAIAEWRRCHDQVTRELEGADEVRLDHLCEVLSEAHVAACSTVATTLSGLRAQLRMAFATFGELNAPEATLDDLDAFKFDDWTDNRERALLFSMLAATSRLAEENVA